LEYKGDIKETETSEKPGEVAIERNLYSLPTTNTAETGALQISM